MSFEPREIQEGSDQELQFYKSAYAGDGDPIPWTEHELNGELIERLERSQVCGWFIDLNQTVNKPRRFFLTAWHAKRPEYLASKGTFPWLNDARKHLGEFSAALLAMLVILAPMLLDGGAL